MKYIFALFILFNISHAYGQKIHFSDTTNRWRILGSAVNWPNISYGVGSYSYKGTIEQNGFTYRILSDGYDTAHIREDSVNSRIYAKVYHNQYLSYIDTNEHLLYDFGLKMGDTFKVQTSAYSAAYVITSIDSTSIGGIWHKVFNLQDQQPYYYSLTIIEGLGCTRDPFLPLFGNFFEQNRQLICFSNNHNYPSLNPAVISFDNSISCKDTVLHIEDAFYEQKLIIYPQPASIYAHIKIPRELMNGWFCLFTADGRKWIEQNIQNKSEIQISKPLNSNSLYFYTLTDAITGKNLSGKILFK